MSIATTKAIPAMLLAAGLGTRMRHLTAERPKPLVPVLGRPMLGYILDHLHQAGIRQLVANAHYHASQIEDYLAGDTRFKSIVSDEREALLDSGGGVKKALPLLADEHFIVLNADSFWLEGPRSNIERLIENFDERMDMLLLVAPTVTAVGWGNRGDFAMDAYGHLRRPAHGEIAPFAYCGVLIMRSALFDETPDKFSLNLLFDRAIAKGRLFGMRLDGFFLHVGTPEAVAEAERAMLNSAR
jgi:N-acetyl-alpha-D-muramate 1-phosphate uridylyltransferase